MPNWKKVVVSGSDAVLNNITATGDVIVKGDLIAERYIISSSVSHITQSFSSGSTIFGDTLDDTHQFTGSLFVTGNSTFGDATFNEITFDTFVFGGSGTPTILSDTNLFISGGGTIFLDAPIVQIPSGNLTIPNGGIFASLSLDNSTSDGIVHFNTTTNELLYTDNRFYWSNIQIGQGTGTSTVVADNIGDSLVFTTGSDNIEIVNSALDFIDFDLANNISITTLTASSAISSSGLLFTSTSNAGGASYNTLMVDTTTGQFYHTGSYGGGGGSDNLGDHTATQDLDMAGFSISASLNITASGNISASNIYGSEYYLNNTSILSNAGNIYYIGAQNNLSRIVGSNIFLDAPTTASIISASSYLQGTHLTIDDYIYRNGDLNTNIKFNNDQILITAGNITQAQFGSGGGSAPNRIGTSGLNLEINSNKILIESGISELSTIDYTVLIDNNTGQLYKTSSAAIVPNTASYALTSSHALYSSHSFTLSGSTENFLVNSDSTYLIDGAGGINIELTEGSFNNFRTTISIDTSSLDTQINNLSSITGSYAVTASNTFTDSQNIQGNITASGNISASGYISASTGHFIGSSSIPTLTLKNSGLVPHIYSPSNLRLESDTGAVYINESSTRDIILVEGGGTVAIGNIGAASIPTGPLLYIHGDVSSSGNLNIENNVTASGNISASGNLIGNEITASGNVNIDGILSLGEFTDVSASLAAAVAGGDNLGDHTATQDLNLDNFDITSVTSASIDHVLITDRLQGNGSGFQFFAYNEDTIKVKFANWYSSNDRQYGMGQLYFETWFAAIDNQANRDNRRIGFYLEEPDAGAGDAIGGGGVHPSNARFYVDITGSYVASGGLHVTDANFNVESNGNVEVNGDITASGNISASNIYGILQTAAQPNITSLGTLTNLTVDDININAANISSTADTNVNLILNNSGIYFEADNGDKFYFNQNQNNVDFQVHSQNDENLIYGDASSDKVGIGTSTPGEKLEVIGNISASGTISASNIHGNNLIIDNEAYISQFIEFTGVPDGTNFRLDYDANGLAINQNGDDDPNTLFSDDSVKFHYPVTASSDISASGLLFASTSDAGGASYNTLMVDTATGQFYHTGSYGSGGGGSGTVTSVGGQGTVDGLTLSGTVTTSGSLTLGGAISITTSSITNFPTEVSRSAAAAGFGAGGGGGISTIAVGTGLDVTDPSGPTTTINLNLTEVIADDSANRVLTTDADGTLTAESGITSPDGKTFEFNTGDTSQGSFGFYTDLVNDIEPGSAADIFIGDIVNLGPTVSTTTAGKVYNLSGSWGLADANDEEKSSYLLGIATTSGANQNKFMLKGYCSMPSSFFSNTTGVVAGSPIYLDSSTGGTPGQYDFKPPGTGETSRIVGHLVEIYSGGRSNLYKIYFNPSPEWIVL